MLSETTAYTFGTMTVGGDVARIGEDMRVVRQAMDVGVWFHTCRNYSSMSWAGQVISPRVISSYSPAMKL